MGHIDKLLNALLIVHQTIVANGKTYEYEFYASRFELR